MSKLARVLVGISALLLAAMYFAPLWEIHLKAPQYPEGLGMHIQINTVTGASPDDLHNINELNHYIGMKVIDPQTIPELRYMPWIVGALIAGALLVAVVGNRKLLYGWVGAFVVVGVVGLVDFWRWEYDYGHNLDMENAIIKVPGMTYQPPIIGAKQLLNFTAISWPGVGGWAAIAAALLAFTAIFLTLRGAPGTAARGGHRLRAA